METQCPECGHEFDTDDVDSAEDEEEVHVSALDQRFTDLMKGRSSITLRNREYGTTHKLYVKDNAVFRDIGNEEGEVLSSDYLIDFDFQHGILYDLKNGTLEITD